MGDRSRKNVDETGGADRGKKTGQRRMKKINETKAGVPPFLGVEWRRSWRSRVANRTCIDFLGLCSEIAQ